MKVTPDDPVLTAYVLGELDQDGRDPVARALSNDEELRNEEAAISSLADLLGSTLGKDELSLGEKRIAEIHRAGKRPDSKILVMEHRKRAKRQSLMAVAGVAALVALGFVVLSRFEVEGDSVVVGGDVAGAGASGGGDLAPGDSSELPGGFKPEKAGVVGLPLRAKQADPSIVERSIEQSGELPERDRFLVADWIHLAKVESAALIETGDFGVSYELGPCSWNPSAALLMVHLRPLKDGPGQLQADLEFNPARVREVRLTGGGGDERDLPATLVKISKPRTFLYELDLYEPDFLEGAEGIGTLLVKAGEEEPRKIALEGPVRGKDEVSKAFQTAVILGDYARWGASEGRDRETLVRLVRGARELLGEVVDESTRYALDMILISEEALGAE